MDRLGKYFPLKPGSVEPPKIYLGCKFSQVTLPDEVNAWVISASQYIQEAVRNVEVRLKNCGMTFTKCTNSVLANGYSPELDIPAQLNDKDASY